MLKKAITLTIAGIVLIANSTFATGEIITGDTTNQIISPTPIDSIQVIACVKAATLAREGNLQLAAKTFSDTALIAYTIRSSAIANAFDTAKIMKDIRPLIKTAFETWKTTTKNAKDTLKSTRKDIWDTYKRSVLLCRPATSTAKDTLLDTTSQQRSEGSIF